MVIYHLSLFWICRSDQNGRILEKFETTYISAQERIQAAQPRLPFTQEPFTLDPFTQNFSETQNESLSTHLAKGWASTCFGFFNRACKHYQAKILMVQSLSTEALDLCICFEKKGVKALDAQTFQVKGFYFAGYSQNEDLLGRREHVQPLNLTRCFPPFVLQPKILCTDFFVRLIEIESCILALGRTLFILECSDDLTHILVIRLETLIFAAPSHAQYFLEALTLFCCKLKYTKVEDHVFKVIPLPFELV